MAQRADENTSMILRGSCECVNEYEEREGEQVQENPSGDSVEEVRCYCGCTK